MNITIHGVQNYFDTYLSVGNLLQNLLFYSVVLLLLIINIVIVKQKKNSLQVDVDGWLNNNLTMREPLNEPTDLNHIMLSQENLFLKNELLSLGEELELAYAKSDRLNKQLSDIAECFEFTTVFDDIMWNWSLDLVEDEVIFSDYGLQMHGFSKGKLTLQAFLSKIDELDRTNISNAISEAIKTRTDFTVPYKINALNGQRPKWFNLTGGISFNEVGVPTCLRGKFSPDYTRF